MSTGRCLKDAAHHEIIKIIKTIKTILHPSKGKKKKMQTHTYQERKKKNPKPYDGPRRGSTTDPARGTAITLKQGVNEATETTTTGTVAPTSSGKPLILVVNKGGGITNNHHKRNLRPPNQPRMSVRARGRQGKKKSGYNMQNQQEAYVPGVNRTRDHTPCTPTNRIFAYRYQTHIAQSEYRRAKAYKKKKK